MMNNKAKKEILKKLRDSDLFSNDYTPTFEKDLEEIERDIDIEIAINKNMISINIKKLLEDKNLDIMKIRSVILRGINSELIYNRHF